MKMFSNSGICICQWDSSEWSNREALKVFKEDMEYPYDYFFGPSGKEIRVFEVDKAGNPSTAHVLSNKEFNVGFMTKAQWNATYGGNKTR